MENVKSDSFEYNKKPASIPNVPSKEDVHKWIKRDLSAASYFLAMMLRYPDIIESLATELYERVLKDQQGAGIDHVNNNGVEASEK